MKSPETLISSITVVAFVATVIFYDFVEEPIQYNCSKLYMYEDVPDEVISECMRILKKQKHLIVT